MAGMTVLSKQYVDKATKQPLEAIIVGGREVPLTREVAQAALDWLEGKPVHTVRVLGEVFPVTRELVTAYMNRPATLRAPQLVAGRTLDAVIQRAFAELRAHGCTVTYAERDRGFFSTTYYGLRVEGPGQYVFTFEKWLKQLNS